MDRDEYRTLSDCLFYTLSGDESITVYGFSRHRDRDTLIWAKGSVARFVNDKGERDVRTAFEGEYLAEDISKSKTGEWIDTFMAEAVHLPFGCTDERTSPGDYWMYPEEDDVTDPVPPVTERAGIVEWTVSTDNGEDRFFGSMEQAMDRLRRADISAATDAIDNLFSDKGEYRKGKGPGGSHAWLSTASKPDMAFTTEYGGLATWEDGVRTGYVSVRALRRFTQRVN